MKIYLDNLSDENDLVAFKSIGKSFENRDIWTVEIGHDYNPKIIIDCGIHAREWVRMRVIYFNQPILCSLEMLILDYMI